MNPKHERRIHTLEQELAACRKRASLGGDPERLKALETENEILLGQLHDFAAAAKKLSAAHDMMAKAADSLEQVDLDDDEKALVASMREAVAEGFSAP